MGPLWLRENIREKIKDDSSGTAGETTLNRRNLSLLVVILVAVGIYVLAKPRSSDRSESSVALQSQGDEASSVTAEPRELGETREPGGTGESGSDLAAGKEPSRQTPTLVGREVCKECHAENYHLHAEHGHADTFHLASTPQIAEKFDGKRFDSGKPYGTYQYHTDDQQNLFVTLPEKFGDEPFPLQYALGSGHNAFTLLTLVPDDAGGTAAIEHRGSWYAGQDGVNITPGHLNKSPREGLEFFGDTSRGEPLEKCISCHTTSARIQGQQLVDLVPSVNCEKCHGAGSEHVRQARANKVPPPYSVGRAEWDTESELQLCGDCHRLPRNISEKELREYPNLLVRFQPVGMLRSRCYLESNGQLKCTTCHPPHQTIHAVTEAQHVQNCVDCHLQNAPDHVACPVSPQEGCIDCHMPAIEQEQGLKFHDHWIRVRDE